MYKGKFEGKETTRQEPARAEVTKQHEAPTTNTKAIMVIKEADLLVLKKVENVL